MRSGWNVWKRCLNRVAAASLWLAGSLVLAGIDPQPAKAAGSHTGAQVALASPQVTEEPAADKAKRLVVARIDLSEQRMTVYVGDRLSHTFMVSTGRGRYRTPTGKWQAQWLSPHHRSKKYHNAPMPWSVFFYRGYAIHGTTEISQLGQPASHGCVRLHPDNAKIFFDLVRENGKANTVISVTN